MRIATRCFLIALLALGSLGAQVFQVDQINWQGRVVSMASGPTAQATGALGSSDLYYWVTARYPAGVAMPAGPARATNTRGIAGLAPGSAVRISWQAAAGATGYDVIRLATPQFPANGTCVNCVVASNIAPTTFLDAGGGVVNWPTAGTVAARANNITAQVNNRDQLGPMLNFSGPTTGPWGIGGLGKIQAGTSTSYFTGFTTGDNIWQIYARDSVATGYTDGISVDLRASGGNGTGGIRPLQILGRAEPGANLGELYGGSFYATQDNGSIVRPNLYGITSWIQINEANAADAPNGYVASVLGIYQTPGVNPTTAFTTPGGKAAILGVVKDGSANNLPDAVVLAMLEGDAAPTAQVPAAFKAVTVRSTPTGQFTYGIDFANQAGPAQPTIAAAGAEMRGGYLSILQNEVALKWRSDSELEVSGPALAALDWSARAGSVQGVGARISSTMAVTTGLKGGDFRATSIGGAAGTIIGAQLISTTGAGTVTLDEAYGVNAIANHNTGTTTNVYGSVGLLNVGAGALLGPTGFGIGALGVYDDSQGVNIATNYTAAVLGSIADRNTAGPDGAVVALLQGDSIRLAANNPVAAFKVIDRTTTAGVGFQYGLDLYFLNGAETNVFELADIRLSAQTEILSGAGVPAGALCHAGNLGSIYISHAGGAGTSLYVCEVAGAWAGK